VATGKAYVNTALNYPGHFGVMCADELVDSDDEEFAQFMFDGFVAS